MLSRRLRLPQSPLRQCCHHSSSVVRFLTEQQQRRKNSTSSPPPPSSSSSSSSAAPSLYDKLFPRKPVPTTARPRASRSSRQSRPSRNPDQASDPARGRTPRPSRRDQDGRESKRINLSLGGDELRAWLEAAAADALSAPSRNTRHKDAGPNAKKVLVLHNMSRSLVESDFYRYAPQGRHVAGWAGGIVKVVQSVSSVTKEPRGQYLVFFDTQSAAEAYLDKLSSLYQLNTTAAAPSQPLPLKILTPPQLLSIAELTNSITTTKNSDPNPDTPPPTEKPPHHIRLKPLHASSTIPAGLPTLVSSNSSNSSKSNNKFPGSTAAARTAAATTASSSSNSSGSSVMVRLTGSKITVDAMIAAIAADGAERNLPWRLTEPPAGAEIWPRQVQAVRAGSGKIGFGEGESGNRAGLQEEEEEEEEEEEADDGRERRGGPVRYGYTRFVVTFADTAEARRFARTWNRRAMVDARTTRSMTVHTAALW